MGVVSGQPFIRLGTRSSPLARWQAEWVSARLVSLGIRVEMIHITTQGDVTTGPLGQIGGQGLFTKEIQRALLDQRIDLAVHSLKDLPTEAIPGLTIAAVPTRESTADVLVGPYKALDDLPPGARIGTGSLRRRAQLLHARPDLQLLEIRGNVDTRLRKLDSGEYDAIVLAQAGLSRLGLAARIAYIIPPQLMLPAVGQGALGLETRADDATTIELLQPLNDGLTHAAVLAERTLLNSLRAGCLAPVGAWARASGDNLLLQATVLHPDGQKRIAAEGIAPPEQAMKLGQTVAADLARQGASELISAAHAGR
ncbi:Porphobilinogen deaminase [Anatilimnocola aggregata]|uniref:Porphobilinogen deaminase n=1 Tax=Anatilimnocola aggregata TaxID=2528021 RepID=A0A517YIB6_9BACT|nr:hydroxymethylbilane synthase [Anatilimnocola aggregata]QDU29977.1 Porphobilinogen deaminase [Anatilimnocola aggregata]